MDTLAVDEVVLPVGSCSWCGASLAGGRRRRGRIVCRECGSATTHPTPTEGELDAAYGHWYRPDSGRFGRVGDALLTRTRASLARRLDRIAPPGAVLDVGAGDGSLVAALHRRGREARGIDRVAGQSVEAVDLADVQGEFAAVVFWHSLEHMRDPRAAVRRAVSLLSPGGVLAIAVPNSDSLQAQAFGDRWFALDLPRHLSHLPARALTDGLAAEGLRVERVSHTRGGQIVFGWLHGLVASLPGRLDLYAAIRSPAAREHALRRSKRLASLAAAVVSVPVALPCALAEVASRRGGTVYVEARNG